MLARPPQHAKLRKQWLVALLFGVVACVPKPHGTYGIRPPMGDAVIDTTGLRGNNPPTSGWTWARRAKNCGNCTVDVWIGAYSLAKTTNPSRLPGTWLKVAMLINTGTRQTAMYNILPHSQVSYYDVEVIADGTSAQWRLVPHIVLAADTTGLTRGNGTVHGCGHPMATVSEADFWDCRPRPVHTESALGFGMSGEMKSLMPLVFRSTFAGPTVSLEDPIWFSCTSGCCTAMLI